MTLLEAVDWNPQFTSVLEFLEFFLSQGSVYSSDSLLKENESNEGLRENTQFENKPAKEGPETAEKPRNSHSTGQENEQRETTALNTNTLEENTPENDENIFDLGDPPMTNPQEKKLQAENESGKDLPKNSEAVKKKHSQVKTYTPTKLTSVPESEILSLVSKIEKDCAKLSYLVIRGK